MKIKYRKYQENIIKKSLPIIQRYGFIYLAMEVRTGKTLTALGIARACGFRNVVFITKKKAISSIQSDYNLLAPNYKFNVINYESMHKLDITRCDFLILDEAHGMGVIGKTGRGLEEYYNMPGAVDVICGTFSKGIRNRGKTFRHLDGTGSAGRK